MKSSGWLAKSFCMTKDTKYLCLWESSSYAEVSIYKVLDIIDHFCWVIIQAYYIVVVNVLLFGLYI